MKNLRAIILALFFFTPGFLISQVKIEETILDRQGDPIIGAHVFLEGTFIGTSSNLDGTFSFTTEEQGVLIK